MRYGRKLSVGCLLSAAILAGACQEVSAPDDECPTVELPQGVHPAPCVEGDTLCVQYLRIWESQVKKRNSISDDYFAEHYLPQQAEINSWIEGESFRIRYTVAIAWAVIPVLDQFLIRLSSSSSSYRYLPLPRDAYLSEDEIEILMDVMPPSSAVTLVAPVETLGYCSQQEAVTALRALAGTDSIGFDRLTFLRGDGHPYLLGKGVLDMTQNACVQGRLNLVTRIGEVWPDVCVIIGSQRALELLNAEGFGR